MFMSYICTKTIFNGWYERLIAFQIGLKKRLTRELKRRMYMQANHKIYGYQLEIRYKCEAIPKNIDLQYRGFLLVERKNVI